METVALEIRICTELFQNSGSFCKALTPTKQACEDKEKIELYLRPSAGARWRSELQ